MHLVKDLLIVGVGVDGGHQALANVEPVMQHLCNGGDAVGCARGVGDDAVGARLVFIIVDAQHNGKILALCRRGDNDLLCAALKVAGGPARVGEDAGGFNDNVHTVIAPGYAGGVTLGNDLDLFAVDGETVFQGLHLAGEAPVGAVIFQEMGVGFGVGQVIDRHDLKVFRVPFQCCFQNLPADASKSVDANACDHCSSDVYPGVVPLIPALILQDEGQSMIEPLASVSRQVRRAE